MKNQPAHDEGITQTSGVEAGQSRVLRARKAALFSSFAAEAYGKGEYVGQENFMRASEILALARAAEVERRAALLDLCCGLGGPLLHIVGHLGGTAVGLDQAAEAVALASERAAGGPSTKAFFVTGDAAFLPFGRRFDVAFLLETMLAIPDKAGLLREVARVLRPGGRFVFTCEEGRPLNEGEQNEAPSSEEVALISEGDLLALLSGAGFSVSLHEDHTAAHAAVAARLAEALVRHGTELEEAVGAAWARELIASHRRWAGWLAAGRVRKLAIVAKLTHPDLARPGDRARPHPA